MATSSPRCCKAVTIFNLLSGLTRAKTLGNGSSSTIASSDNRSSSLPRIARFYARQNRESVCDTCD